MANRAIEPVLLPWKRPKKGVSVAVLGARFRVEQLEDGWHCTVKVGRQVEVLATGLPRLRDAQFRAEAHAATLPAVMAAVNRQDTEDRRAEQEPPKTPATPTKAHADEPAVTPGAEVSSLTFEEVSDGCICGKINGRTWLADPDGGVSVPLDMDPAVAQEICRLATNYYTARQAQTSATPRAKSTAKPSKKGTGRRGGRKAKPEPPAPPASSKPSDVTWNVVDGKIRGVAKHGTFFVEPEGKRHALYFYDADGQSRHLESGEAGKLRKVAEEMTARGLPAARSMVSGFNDAALLRAFLGDDA